MMGLWIACAVVWIVLSFVEFRRGFIGYGEFGLGATKNEALYGMGPPKLVRAEGASAPHGLTVAATGGVAALVVDGVTSLTLPGVVQAGGVDAAIAALRRGADEVVLASDSDMLVAARIAALVRRVADRALVVGDLAIDLIERRAARDGRRLPLLPREYALLVHLARATGRIVPRAELTRDVLGLAFDPGTNVIAAHLSKLRAKLHHGFDGAMLHTEKGSGYRLVAATGSR